VKGGKKWILLERGQKGGVSLHFLKGGGLLGIWCYDESGNTLERVPRRRTKSSGREEKGSELIQGDKREGSKEIYNAFGGRVRGCLRL